MFMNIRDKQMSAEEIYKDKEIVCFCVSTEKWPEAIKYIS